MAMKYSSFDDYLAYQPQANWDAQTAQWNDYGGFDPRGNPALGKSRDQLIQMALGGLTRQQWFDKNLAGYGREYNATTNQLGTMHDNSWELSPLTVAGAMFGLAAPAMAASSAGGWANASNALDAPVFGSSAGAFGTGGAVAGGNMAYDPLADFGADYFSGGNDYTGGAWTPPSPAGIPNVVQPDYDYSQFMNDIGIDPASTQFSGGTMTNAQIMQQIGGDPSALEQFKQAVNNLPAEAKTAAKSLIQKVLSGDTSAVGDLAKLGIPLALAAGVFEKPSSPLTGTLTNAANKAVESAGAFAGMQPVGMMPSSQKAIDNANSSAGAWKPYVDQSATFTNKAAGGIPSVNLNDYMNPYLDSVLSPAIRDINEAAAQREQALRATVSKSGNDFRTPGVNRFNVEDDLLDRSRLRAIGDVSANTRKAGYDAATGLASADLGRDMTAGGAFNTMASTVGTQGGADFTRLGAAGELEAKPAENALTKAADTTKLYTSVLPGTTSAVTATKNPSVLGQAVGAFGAYNAADKLGLLK